MVNYYPVREENNVFPDGLGYGLDSIAICDTVDSLYVRRPETPIAIEFNTKIWNPDTKMVDLSLTIRNDGPELSGSYWYNVIITEDSIKSPHKTWSGCSTPDHPGQPYMDSDYINSWVTREMVFCCHGKTLIDSVWLGQQEINQYCSFYIDDAWILQNCNVTVHVFERVGVPNDSLYKNPTMQVVQEPIIGWSDITESKPLEKGIIGIYPNPTKGLTNIHIALADKGFCSLSVFDMNGRVVKRLLQSNRNPGLYNIEMQTNELPSGTYIVVLETSTGKISKKLVIQ